MRNKQATQVSPLADTTISSQQSVLPVSQGQTQVLSLEHNHHTSSIMFKGQGGDRNSLQSSLRRIPASITLRNSFPIFAKSKDQDNVRLVVKEAPLMSYSFSSTPDVRLPSVLDRRKKTILIESETLRYHIERVGKRNIEDGNDSVQDDDGHTDTRITKYVRKI